MTSPLVCLCEGYGVIQWTIGVIQWTIGVIQWTIGVTPTNPPVFKFNKKNVVYTYPFTFSHVVDNDYVVADVIDVHKVE